MRQAMITGVGCRIWGREMSCMGVGTSSLGVGYRCRRMIFLRATVHVGWGGLRKINLLRQPLVLLSAGLRLSEDFGGLVLTVKGAR